MSNIVSSNTEPSPDMKKKTRRDESYSDEILSTNIINTISQIDKSETHQSLRNSISTDLDTYKGFNIDQILSKYRSDHYLVGRSIIEKAQERYDTATLKNKTEESIEIIGIKEPPDNSSFPLYNEQIKSLSSSTSSFGFSDLKTPTPGSKKKIERRKKRKKGEPRRKFATLYHTPEGAAHAVDITRVCQSTSSLNKMKNTEKKFLADSYQQMSDAKKDHDDAQKLLNQYKVQYDHHLQTMVTMRENIQAQQEIVRRTEEAIQLASDNVTDQELKVDCPWNENYKRLCNYREKYGNIDLPTRCPDDKELDSLCCWIQAQKQKYQDYREGCKITFKPYRILLLEKLGIVWNVRNNLWNKHFETLKKFKEEFGHVLVPTKTPPPAYKELAAWVVYQRDQYKSIIDEKMRNKIPVKPVVSLTPERVNKLKEIGFVFNVFDERWKTMYSELKKSNKNYASFKKEYPQLNNWVKRQRLEYELYHTGQRTNKRCRLTPERIKLLDELDFPWKGS